MIQIGKSNTLPVIRVLDIGAILDGAEAGEILLPRRYLPTPAIGSTNVGDRIEVFIHYDSEDRLIATTQKPLGEVGKFALLKVVAVEEVGAFLDWGLPKDLFLPFSEQTRDLRIGIEVLVFLYLDKSHRISASMRIERHLSKEVGGFKELQPVDLIVCGKTDLGYKAIINQTHLGVLYENEVFQKIQYGQELKAFIKKVRPDGKIDLSLQKTGHQAGQEIEPLIISELKKKNGFLDINDKTSAELIYELFGVSKKKYKIALGGLYKKKLITIHDDGIRLTQKAIGGAHD